MKLALNRLLNKVCHNSKHTCTTHINEGEGRGREGGEREGRLMKKEEEGGWRNEREGRWRKREGRWRNERSGMEKEKGDGEGEREGRWKVMFSHW